MGGFDNEDVGTKHGVVASVYLTTCGGDLIIFGRLPGVSVCGYGS